nr:PREDICTED: olfactory receptor 1F12-like [Lepisosteus oculatus]
MIISNQTVTNISEFIVNGFSGIQDQRSQNILFAFFLITYVLTLFGNVSILIVIKFDKSLHTPMYTLIGALAFLDLCIPSVTVPKILTNLMFRTKSIEFGACFTQMVFYLGVGSTESFLLMVMAYDRYVAVCDPLHYSTIMIFVFITYRIQGFSDDVRIMAAVLQNVIPPLVNPIIYCLKTRDIRKSFLKFIRKQVSVEALLTGF